jgi:hypothetical protein
MSNEYRSIEGRCKVCGKVLALRVHQDYDPISDPAKLLPMATCDRCYDFRDAYIKMREGLTRLCSTLHYAPVEKMTAVKVFVEPKITDVLKKFCWAIARYNGNRQSPYDESMAHAVCDNPSKWPEVILQIVRTFKTKEQPALNLPSAEPSLPYKDA